MTKRRPGLHRANKNRAGERRAGVRNKKDQVETDLAFKLKLSAGGSLFRIGTRRRRRRSRGHRFFFLRACTQA